MFKYINKKIIIFLIILTHVFINFELYCDSFLKIGAHKINLELVSPKGRYKVEFYKVSDFTTIVTIYDYFSGYAMVYDNKLENYIYESPVYYGMDCGALSFPDELRPTILDQCFETQQLELEE